MENLSREITVISTRGNKMKKYTMGQDLTWGDVKSVISADYDLSGLKAVENINKTSLELDGAAIPNGNIRIFMRPAQTKAGGDFDNMSFQEMRQEFIADNPPLKDYLNEIASEDGRNWTQLGTQELRDGLSSFYRTEERNYSEESLETTSSNNSGVITSIVSSLRDIANTLESMGENEKAPTDFENEELNDIFTEMNDIFGE